MVQIKKSSLKKYHKASRASAKAESSETQSRLCDIFICSTFPCAMFFFAFAFLPVKAFKEINRKLSSRAYGYGQCECVCVCIGVLGLSSSFVVSQLNLPPTTRQVITISSPSCLGPN